METLLQFVSSAFMPALFIVAMLMPFWYIVLYLFHRAFFDQAREILKWCFAFGLSFGWYIFFILYTLLVPNYRPIHIVPNEPLLPLNGGKIEGFYFSTGGLALLAIIISILCIYLRYRSRPRDIVVFLKLAYSAMGAAWVLRVILALIIGHPIA